MVGIIFQIKSSLGTFLQNNYIINVFFYKIHNIKRLEALLEHNFKGLKLSSCEVIFGLKV